MLSKRERMGSREGMQSFRKRTCQGLVPKPWFNTHVGMTIPSYLKSFPLGDLIGYVQQDVELWGLELYLSRTSSYGVFPGPRVYNHRQRETIINCYDCIPCITPLQWCNYTHHNYVYLGLSFMRFLDLVDHKNSMILHKQGELWYSLWVDVIPNFNS